MNVQRDEFVNSVVADNGATYNLYEVPADYILALDGDVVALAGSAPPRDGYVVVRHSAKPEMLFEVHSIHQAGAGRFSSRPAAAAFVSEGYEFLTVIPAAVYSRGVPADEDLGPASPTVRIRVAGWCAMPAECQFVEDGTMDMVALNGRRFVRLTQAGLANAKAEKDIADQAERDRKNVDAKIAAQMHEEERLQREAREAEHLRQEDEAKRAAQHAWLDQLPAHLLPGTLVVDLREATPKVCEVRYGSVWRDGDQFFFNANAKGLPRRGAVVSKANADEHRIIRDGGCYRDGRYFDLHRLDHFEFYAPYSGPDVALGTRVSRPPIPVGQVDKYGPAFGELLIAHIKIVGNRYTDRVDSEFSVDLALEFLKKRHPKRSTIITREYDDDEADRGPEDPPSRGTYQEKVMQDVEERYPEYHEYGFEGHDWPWDSVDWEPADKRSITEEMLLRRGQNVAWGRQKETLAQILKSALGARLVAPEGDDEDGDAGLHVQMALTGADLDRLGDFLECQSCRLWVYVAHELPTPDFLTTHRLPEGRLEDVIERWKASKGSPQLFRAMTDDLLTDSIGFDWTIKYLLPAGELGALVAPAKIGKGVLSFCLGAYLTTNTPFAGLAVKQGKVIILTGEDGKNASGERWMRASAELDLTSADLMIIPAKAYEFSIEKAIADFKVNVPDLRLLIIDHSAIFVPDTNNGGAARAFTNCLLAFAQETGATVLFIHHTAKELTAATARSSKSVMGKFKGSGEFFNAARFILTLHIETDSRDDTVALQTGLRCLTLHPANNISRTIARLTKPLRLRMDPKTGLLKNLDDPVVGLPLSSDDAEAAPKATKRNAPATPTDNVDDDARTAVPIILAWEKQWGRRLAYAGEKSLFKLKAEDELVGWSRRRCELAHRRAIELGLCKAA